MGFVATANCLNTIIKHSYAKACAVRTLLYLVGEAYWFEITQENKTKNELALDESNLTRQIAQIRLLYNDGAPIFTKEMIKNVGEQLEVYKSLPQENRKDQSITVRALDGNSVDFKLESGRILPAGTSPLDKRALEMVVTDPFIAYIPLQDLTCRERNKISRIGSCSLQIHHFMELRETGSQKYVDKIPIHSEGEVLEFFQVVQNTWEASQPCQQLRSTLMSMPIRCRKVVALALGSMAYLGELSYRPAIQHALLLTLWDVLGKVAQDASSPTSAYPVACYAQDPAYAKVDQAVLAGHGVTVLDDPKGFLEVDDSTAVLSCCAGIPVKQIISDIANPAIMIVDRVLDRDPDHAMQDPDSPRLRKLIQESYDIVEFTGDQEDFSHLTIYVRRPTR